jgi:hypothetical protein
MTNGIFSGLDSQIFGESINQDEFEASLKNQTEVKAVVLEESENKEEPTKEVGFTLDELENDFVAATDDDEAAKLKDKEIANEKPAKVFEKDKKAENSNENGKENNLTPTIFQTVSEFFKEEGLTEIDFTDKDSMIETFKTIITSEVEGYKEGLPQVIQDLVSNYEDGVPLMDLISIKSEQIMYNNVDASKLEDDVDLQKRIVENHYKETTRFSDERIKKEITKLEELDELFDMSKENLEELKALKAEEEEDLKKEAVVQKAKQAESNKIMLKKVDDTVKATKEIIPGKKITEKEQKELYQSLTSAVEYRGNQAVTLAMKTRETDPIAFDMKLNYFIKQGLFEGKFDAVTKKVETAVTKNLEKQLEEAVRAKQNKTGQAATLESKTAKEAELAWKHRLK